MIKKLAIAAAVLVVLAVAGFVILYQNLDKIVRAATEKGIAFVLQVPVSIGGATVKAGEGSIEFREIVIGNPKDYSTDRAMRFGKVLARVDLKSIRTDEPTVVLVQLSESEITFEARRGGSNLQDLMNNASRLSKKEKEEPPPPADQKQKAFKINKVIVDHTKVRASIPFMGGQTLDVPLPDIEMKDIGGKKERVTPAEALEKVLAEMLNSIKTAGSSILPTEVLSGIGESLQALPGDVLNGLSGAGEAAGKTVEGAAGAAQDAAKGAGKAVQGIGEGIGGLLGGKKDAAPKDPRKK